MGDTATGSARGPEPGDEALRLDGLGKTYSRGLFRAPRVALRSVSFALTAGHCVALVGPNGSGKSTLLRIAAGSEPPTAGSVRVFGRPPTDREARAATGYLGDDAGLPRELRAREALRLVAALGGVPARERAGRVEAALERVGLAREARTLLGRFSAGMLRRFGLAAATVNAPRLLLLDEPSAGLDAPGHLVLRGLVDEARARGSAVLLATHQLDDLALASDGLVVLVDGQAVAAGTPAALADRTRSVRLELEDASSAVVDELVRRARAGGSAVLQVGPGSNALRRLYARGVGDAGGPVPGVSGESSPEAR